MIIVSLFASAIAGPAQDVAQIDFDNAREIHRSVRTAEVGGKVQLSKTCMEAHAAATEQVEKARILFEAGKGQDAYDGIHATLVALRPCAEELSRSTKSYQIAVKAILRSSDAQLAALNAHLEAKTTPAAAEALEAATKAKQASRAHGLAGELPEALSTWYAMVDAIHTAVKASS